MRHSDRVRRSRFIGRLGLGRKTVKVPLPSGKTVKMRVEARVVGRVDPSSLAYTRLRGRLKTLPPDATRLSLKDVWLSGVDFRGRTFDGLVFDGRSVIEGCDFSGMRVSQMGWGRENTLFRDCRFRGTEFPPEMMLGPVRFERCLFDCRLEKMFSHAGEFVDCTFTGLLHDCTFFGRPSGLWKRKLQRTTNEFSNNDFTQASFRDTDFREGVVLSDQRFPAGVMVIRDSEEALNRFEAAIHSLGESAPRILIGHARAWRHKLEYGQAETFFNPADLPAMPAEMRQTLMAAVAPGGSTG